MKRGAKPLDERADFGAPQFVGGAIDGEHRRHGGHLFDDLESVLPERLAGLDEVDDAIRKARDGC